MRPLVRYLLSDVVRSQRWIGPVLAFLVALMIVTPTSGPVLPTYAVSAATLTPVAMWLTVVVLHNEEVSQADITLAAAGGVRRVWPAKLVSALIGAAVLGLLGLGWITVVSLREVTAAGIGVGAVDFAMAAVAGVAFGGLIGRPVVRRIGWTVVLGGLILLADLLIRQAPPINGMLQLYRSNLAGAAVGSTLLVAAWTVVLSAAVTVLARWMAGRRS